MDCAKQVGLDEIAKDGGSLESWYRDADGALMARADLVVAWGDCYRVGDLSYVSREDFDRTVPEEVAGLYVCVANLVDAGLADMTFESAAALVREHGIKGIERLLEPISDSCRDVVYFTEMYPDCYSDADLEEAAAGHPELFSVDYCNRYPELQAPAVSKGIVDLFDLDDPTPDALAAWFDVKRDALAGMAVDTAACWGGNMSVPDGWVTEEQWDSVLPDERSAEVFRVYSAAYGEEEREALLAHLDDSEWLSKAWDRAFSEGSCDCYYTEIWPGDFSPSELLELRGDRPDLFTDREVELYSELAGLDAEHRGLLALPLLEADARAAASDRPSGAARGCVDLDDRLA